MSAVNDSMETFCHGLPASMNTALVPLKRHQIRHGVGDEHGDAKLSTDRAPHSAVRSLDFP